jgi:hypothetical protein
MLAESVAKKMSQKSLILPLLVITTEVEADHAPDHDHLTMTDTTALRGEDATIETASVRGTASGTGMATVINLGGMIVVLAIEQVEGCPADRGRKGQTHSLCAATGSTPEDQGAHCFLREGRACARGSDCEGSCQWSIQRVRQTIIHLLQAFH